MICSSVMKLQKIQFSIKSPYEKTSRISLRVLVSYDEVFFLTTTDKPIISSVLKGFQSIEYKFVDFLWTYRLFMDFS